MAFSKLAVGHFETGSKRNADVYGNAAARQAARALVVTMICLRDAI